MISRLRRVSETIGAGSFRIETITKIGYRLVPTAPDDAPAIVSAAPAALATAKTEQPPAEPKEPSRRRLLVAGGSAAVVAILGGGGAWFSMSHRAKALPQEVEALIRQANEAGGQGTREGAIEELNLRKRIAEMAPNDADVWGLLAISYCNAAWNGEAQDESDARAHAAEAIARAKALEPTNTYARLAEAFLLPAFGNWRAVEVTLRSNEIAGTDKRPFIGALCGLMADVGRCREAAQLNDQIWQPQILSPTIGYNRVVLLWSAGRLREAELLMDQTFQLFPAHFAVWFTRFYMFLYTGRPRRALAMVEDEDGHPSGIDDADIEAVGIVARAMIDRTAASIDRAIHGVLDYAHRGAGYAENAIQAASALGRLDDAFAVANAYFFARGFDPGELRFRTTNRVFTRHRERRTAFLFQPATAAMRRDPRFATLCAELGLTRYWQLAGTAPDYRLV